MFNKTITGLTLTKQVADGVFQNIKGTGFNGDVSFLATLRALLYKRMPKEESIKLTFSASRYTDTELRGASPENCIRAFIRGSGILDGKHGIINIHSFEGGKEGNDYSFQVLDSDKLNAVVGGFTAMPDVAKFLEQSGKFTARVFINEERKCTLIFVDNLDIKRWHLLQSLIPRYLPWYTDVLPYDEEELVLLKTLTQRYAPDYVDIIENIADRFDFRTEAIRNSLKGFENKFEEDQLYNVRSDITDIRNMITHLETQFQDAYQRLNEYTAKELGLIAKMHENGDGEEETELTQYFLCNKNLDLVSVEGGEIQFIVTTTISSFDPDLAETALNKENSFFYRHYETRNKYENKELTDKRIKRLMSAIFIDETLKLRVCAAYKLDFTNGSYRGCRGYYFSEDYLREYTPNQHIQHYACLGNNEPHIRRAMLDRDYVGAVANCCASATNINLSESNTGTFFMEKICANDVGKIIQMPDGSNMTPLDAVKWLEAQDAEKQKEKEEN